MKRINRLSAIVIVLFVIAVGCDEDKKNHRKKKEESAKTEQVVKPVVVVEQEEDEPITDENDNPITEGVDQVSYNYSSDELPTGYEIYESEGSSTVYIVKYIDKDGSIWWLGESNIREVDTFFGQNHADRFINLNDAIAFAQKHKILLEEALIEWKRNRENEGKFKKVM